MYGIYNFVNNSFFVIVASLSSLACVFYLFEFFARFKAKSSPDFFSQSLIPMLTHNKLPPQSNKIIAIIIHLIFIFTLLFGSNYFIVKNFDCDDLRLMPDGTYCYFVKATNEKGKTYTLPANIHKIDGLYSVHNVYFDNGGYLYFRETCVDMEYEDINDCIDQDDREWQIELTNWKTSHHMVNETEPHPTKDDYYRFVMVGLQAITVILHIYFLLNRTEE